MNIEGLLFATIHTMKSDISYLDADFENGLELRNVGQSQMSGHHSKAIDLLVQMRY